MRLILLLGGNAERAAGAMRQAGLWPDADIVVGSEREVERAWAELRIAGTVPASRVRFDFKAWDTLTHFTTLDRDATDLAVVTDRWHMRRALWLARIVLFGSGIRLHAVPVVTTIVKRERWWALLGDVARALVWRLTFGALLIHAPAVRRRQRRELRASAVRARALRPIVSVTT